MPVPSQWTFSSVKCRSQHLKKWLTIKFWLICIDQVVTLAKTKTYDMPEWGNQVEYLGNRSDINFSQPNIDEFVLTNTFANRGKKDQDAVTVTEAMFTLYRIAFYGAIRESVNRSSPGRGGTSRSHIEHRARLRAVFLFSVVRQAKRETRKWPRAWLMVRDGRGFFLLGLPPSFRASRGFAAPARVHCSH